jgi:large subunit ribosomal protein L23
MTLLKPVITEKSMMNAARGVFTFQIENGTRKSAVRTLVQDLFKVHVTKVTTKVSHNEAKKTGARRLAGTIGKSKYATVWLKKGESIALFDLKEGK